MLTFATAPDVSLEAGTISPSLEAALQLRGDMLSLGAHLRDCARARGRYFSLHCWAERLHGLMLPRFCTTILVVGGLLAAGALWA